MRRSERARIEARQEMVRKDRVNQPRKQQEFIKSQQEFLVRKNASLEKSRVLVESKMAENCTHKPEINPNSKRLSSRRKHPNPSETPMNLLSKTL